VREVRLPGVSFYDLAEHLSSRPDFALLDSRTDDGGLGEFSMFSFAPFARIVSKAGRTVVREDGCGREAVRDVFGCIQEMLDRHRIAPPACFGQLPFLCGAIGYLSYELGRQIEVLPATARDELGLPDCYLCFYNFAVVLSRRDGRMFLCHFQPAGNPSALSMNEVMAEICDARPGGYTHPVTRRWSGGSSDCGLQPDLTRDAYIQAVRRIKEYIVAGDVYQVDMTQRFRVGLNGAHPWDLYKHLMEINPAPFAAYLNLDDHVVVSSSPERFLRLVDGCVETRPIKGTVKRGASAEEDASNREWLLGSAKNRAELAMIVDLLRNDLGRVCTPGTVRVRAFPELESYASVHHLVATITGQLAQGKTTVDLIRATFPGGSITGAPKIRAMEIIDELEPVTRGVYTGSIGYIGFNGSADLNIAIRTIIVQHGQAYIHAGGGIVADSDEAEEYEESLLKAAKLFKAVEGVRPVRPPATGDWRAHYGPQRRNQRYYRPD
jgi:para-aminobenzoate synthetase component 1